MQRGVSDMAASVAFFELLGLEVENTTDAFRGSRYAILEDPDGNSIGAMSPPDPSPRSPPPMP